MNETVKNEVEITKNSYHDDGDGIVSFPNGLCISDNQTQRNGTKYDLESLDISKYGGQLTADHEDKLKNIIGKVEGVAKKNGRLTINKITYAVKQNPYARLAYDLLVGGFSNAFSTETIGPSANSADGTLYNHELVGLSQVVCPNNYSAIVNTVRNSLNKAKSDGLDISELENELLKRENEMDVSETNPTELVENKSKKDEADEEKEVLVEEAEVKEVETSVGDEEGTEDDSVVEVVADDEETSEEQEEEDEEKDEKKKKTNETDEAETDEVEKVENEISDEQVKELFDRLDNLSAQLQKMSGEDKLEGIEGIVEDDINEVEEDIKENNEIEENTMDKSEIQNAVAEALKGYFSEAAPASAPEFTKAENSLDYADLDWKERYSKQVNAAWEAFRVGDIAARKTLNEINEVNLNELKEAGIAKNSMTIASMGNFVIPPEMYKEIVGKRTDYSAILNATDWRETDSLEFAWLKRNGDIDMQNVAMCDDDEDGNLKPISEYTAEPVTSKLEEMAAVTVVCNAATRFFAVDLLADVAAGYRNDYDRKRAQLVIARLEQAVAETGQSIEYAPESDTEALGAFLDAVAEVSDAAVEGVLIFNNKTYSQIRKHIINSGNGSASIDTFTDGSLPRINGVQFIVVPNDLMPTIESDDAISFTVDGETVAISHAVFYADLSEFVGYTSGGLQYDVATEASYEVGGVVRSAYQRNELVLRGSFFRGGAVKDTTRVSGIEQLVTES